MNKDEIKGKMRDAKGRIKRQAGEWTGDKEAQAEGIKDQAAGKTRSALGKVKDVARDAGREVRDAGDDAERDIQEKEAERGINRERSKRAA